MGGKSFKRVLTKYSNGFLYLPAEVRKHIGLPGRGTVKVELQYLPKDNQLYLIVKPPEKVSLEEVLETINKLKLRFEKLKSEVSALEKRLGLEK